MQRILKRYPSFFLLLIVISFALPAQAVSFSSLLRGPDTPAIESAFLPVEEAFQVDGVLGAETITINFTVTPAHYLYQHMLSFEAVNPQLTQLGEPVFPSGVSKFDPFMKRELETYPTDVSVTIPIQSSEEFPEIRVHYQGCADAGLCYPPSTLNIIPVRGSAAATPPVIPTKQVQAPITSTREAPQGSFLSALLSEASLLHILGLFFLGGLALTFTPCVLPMIPIVSTMVANSQASRSHNILLTACYVLAMSATYAVAGLLMGYFGASLNLQARLQSPWLLIPFAILFVLLALSMFGLYELQLPEKLRDKLSKADQKSGENRKGTFTGATLAGVFSTLIVSPCVSAPLAGALVYISSTGDMTIGGLSLFTLGLGMGLPLFLVGAGGASLLPKAGAWMDGVKAVFGVLMLGVAVWMLERIIPESVTLLLWGALAIGSAVYLGALDFNKSQGWQALRQVFGVLLLLYGATLFVGGIQGNTNPLQPLGQPALPLSGGGAPASQKRFTIVTSSQELDDSLTQAAMAGKPVFPGFLRRLVYLLQNLCKGSTH